MLEIIEVLIVTVILIALARAHYKRTSTLEASSNCKKETADMTNENTTTQPASVDSITVEASSAKVTIEYGDVSEIEIQRNNPEEFEVTNLNNTLSIKEKASSSISGISMTNGIFGGNCSVVCTGSMFGLSQSMIGGKHIVKVNGLTITSSAGCQIRIDRDIITINGRQLKSPSWGSTIEVKADGIFVNGEALQQSEGAAPAKPKERNALRITVPRDCQCGLQIIGNSDAEFSLPAWNSQKYLKVDLHNRAQLKAGSMKCRLVEAYLNNNASATFNDIAAKGADLSTANNAGIVVRTLSAYAMDIRTTNNASVQIKAGTTETGTARSTNNSAIRLKGNFEHIRAQKFNNSVISIRKS